MNIEATKPPQVTAMVPATEGTPQRMIPILEAAVPHVTAAAEEEQEQRARRMKAKIAKHEKNKVKFMNGEPVREESDGDADERNLTREDIEQAMVEAVVRFRATDPARLEGVTTNTSGETHSEELQP